MIWKYNNNNNSNKQQWRSIQIRTTQLRYQWLTELYGVPFCNVHLSFSRSCAGRAFFFKSSWVTHLNQFIKCSDQLTLSHFNIFAHTNAYNPFKIQRKVKKKLKQFNRFHETDELKIIPTSCSTLFNFEAQFLLGFTIWHTLNIVNLEFLVCVCVLFIFLFLYILLIYKKNL